MPNFVSFVASIAELTHGEKLRIQSLNQSSSLFDASGTKSACISEQASSGKTDAQSTMHNAVQLRGAHNNVYYQRCEFRYNAHDTRTNNTLITSCIICRICEYDLPCN